MKEAKTTEAKTGKISKLKILIIADVVLALIFAGVMSFIIFAKPEAWQAMLRFVGLADDRPMTGLALPEDIEVVEKSDDEKLTAAIVEVLSTSQAQFNYRRPIAHELIGETTMSAKLLWRDEKIAMKGGSFSVDKGEYGKYSLQFETVFDGLNYYVRSSNLVSQLNQFLKKKNTENEIGDGKTLDVKSILAAVDNKWLQVNENELASLETNLGKLPECSRNYNCVAARYELFRSSATREKIAQAYEKNSFLKVNAEKSSKSGATDSFALSFDAGKFWRFHEEMANVEAYVNFVSVFGALGTNLVDWLTAEVGNLKIDVENGARLAKIEYSGAEAKVSLARSATIESVERVTNAARLSTSLVQVMTQYRTDFNELIKAQAQDYCDDDDVKEGHELYGYTASQCVALMQSEYRERYDEAGVVYQTPYALMRWMLALDE